MLQGSDVVLIATRNKGKAREFAAMFAELGKEVRSLHDYPDMPEVAETGETFAANAYLKASAIARIAGVPVLADDSGLCVDALGGAPGVYSARYAGEHAADADNNAKLLRELAAIGAGDAAGRLSPARFVCALALVDPVSGRTVAAEGECAGWIVSEPRGEGGFGYDPLFCVPAYGKTMAELPAETKQRISHRAQALERLLAALAAERR
ncbi:MAG: XTP/dITP diphosphatase [Paenibacillaceae bacterium]|nr:XTP/dITP diphosphatase [Paenibacillaceae bacterium]